MRSALGSDLWTHSLSRGEATRWTFDESSETSPTWSPGGEFLYFEDGSPQNVYRFALSGNGKVEQLTNQTDGGWYPYSITPDGRYLLITEWPSPVADGRNIVEFDLDGQNGFRYLMQTDYHESHPMLSPDGTLLAYMSNRSGSMEIWVRQYPGDDGKLVRVSISGNCWQPRWNKDSRELFFWCRDEKLIYSARLDTSPDLSAASPRALFSTEPYDFQGSGNYDYDPTRNKFLMIKKPPPGSTTDEIVLIENWKELVSQ